MLKNSSLKIDSIINKHNIDEVTFLPNHKYSFVYNGIYYVGFFKKQLEKDNKQMYMFSNFSIEKILNDTSYIYDLQHHKLSPNIARLLQQDRFSDSDSDGFESDFSPIYKKLLERQFNDDFDDYVKVDIYDFRE